MEANTSQSSRQNRFQSHALVEIRKYKHLPFGVNSAVLLDISIGGFKAEFTSEVKAKPGEKFWISIPLSPLGIFAPSKFMCQAEFRWFDQKRFRVGGVFFKINEADTLILEKVIKTLQEKNHFKK